MRTRRTRSVTELEGELLDVLAQVEAGESFDITRDGEVVAVLGPPAIRRRAATSFGRIEVRGPLEVPAAIWRFDLENIRPRRR